MHIHLSLLDREGKNALYDAARPGRLSEIGGAFAAGIIRHMRAIPQYNLGHAERLAAIDADLRRHPRLYLAGNSYRGIAINACIADARAVAATLAIVDA